MTDTYAICVILLTSDPPPSAVVGMAFTFGSGTITRLALTSSAPLHPVWDVRIALRHRPEFDDLKRSRALTMLAHIRSERLVTEEEFASFSREIRRACPPPCSSMNALDQRRSGGHQVAVFKYLLLA